MKKSVFRTASIAALILLLLKPASALSGARDGLLLWSQTVLPTLLPFMICSNVIVALGAVDFLTFPFRPVLHQLLKLSNPGSYILISGLLCGYPMGAKTCNEFLDEERITPAEGAYLLSICNHPSPMFLLGYVSSFLPQQMPMAWILAAVYLPILPLSLVSRKIYGIDGQSNSKNPKSNHVLSFDQTMMNSIEVMVKIGGYIMLFSILASYIGLLPLHSSPLRAFLLGVVEITTGIKAISQEMKGPGLILAIVAVTAFGGLSGIFQTKSVIKNAGLSIRHYICWKLLHSLLSCLFLILLLQAWYLPAG